MWRCHRPVLVGFVNPGMFISNKPSFRQEDPGVATALTALIEHRTLWRRIKCEPSPRWWVVLHTYAAVAIIPCLLFLQRVALNITPWTLTQTKAIATPALRLLYFESGMWWRIPNVRQDVCYTLCRGSMYAVAVNPTPSVDYAFLRPTVTFYLFAIAIYRMPRSPIYV